MCMTDKISCCSNSRVIAFFNNFCLPPNGCLAPAVQEGKNQPEWVADVRMSRIGSSMEQLLACFSTHHFFHKLCSQMTGPWGWETGLNSSSFNLTPNCTARMRSSLKFYHCHVQLIGQLLLLSLTVLPFCIGDANIQMANTASTSGSMFLNRDISHPMSESHYKNVLLIWIGTFGST